MPPKATSGEIHENDDFEVTGPLHSKIRKEMKELLGTALPTLACMLLYRFPWLISLRFVGDIGADELAAAALASTLCNVTGLSLSVGLSSAITTLTGQARGDLNARSQIRRTKREPNGSDWTPIETSALIRSKKVGEDHSELPLTPLVFLYRGIFIQLAFVLPIGIWWISGVKSVLIGLGQGYRLSTMTEAYLRILTPGLWSYSVNWTLTAWLQSMEMADVPAWASAFGLAIHIPCNMLFIHKFDWGYLGVAWATVVFQLIQPVIVLFYLFFTDTGRERILKNMFASGIGRNSLSFWKEAKIAVWSLTGIRQYLSLALPGIVSISEWWASEISIFLSGHLEPSPVLALGGMTLYQSINSFCFMFPMAFSIAGSTRVSNLLGAGQPRAASFSGNMATGCAGLSSITLGCVLFFTPHMTFPSLFAPGETGVIAQASKTIPLLSIYIFADGTQVALNGVLKGCGRQVWAMPIVVFAYWIVGLPLAYYLAFIRNDGRMCQEPLCGVVGLVTGMTIGTWLHMLLFAVLVRKTNWKREAQKAQERVRQSQESSQSMNASA